jgi:hypothetical protein
MVETTTTVIANPHPRMLSRGHIANIIDYCAETDNADELASWGEELSNLFRNGSATALEACNYFIDALNESVNDVAWYSLDRDNNLTVRRPAEEQA